MNIFRILCYIVVVVISICKCQMDPRDNSKSTKKKYCGQNLSQTISTVCEGKYNTLSKKVDVIERKGFWSNNYNSEMEETSFPFTRKARAIAMITKYQRRRKRGVFDECCKKACTLKELSNYCY